MNPKDLDLFSQHASTRKETNRLFVVRCNFCFALLCHLCISDVNYAPPQEDQPLPSARSLRQQHEHTVFAPWSSGVVNMAILGSDVLGVVGYHSGIQTSSRVVRSANSTVPVVSKVLLHSGVDDDAATDVALLEQEFEAAGATFEIVRYGSDVLHSFTEWSANSPGFAVYDHRADYRSWESTKLFLNELFTGLPAAERGPENAMMHTALQNYTCNTTTCEGYIAYNNTHCTSSSKCPAVVIIQDWTGMDDYEMERARMLGGMGYVAFAADIYGRGTPAENMADWGAAAGAHRGNPDLYMSKINAALDQVKTYDFIDTTKIAVIGYCFGGSGVVNMAILGSDVLGVVGYHSGIQTSARVVRSENSTVPMVAKVLLHSGVDDDAATDVALLEQEFEGAKATYEIVPWYCFKILVFLLYMFLYGLCSYTPLRTIARVVLWPHLPYRRPVLCLTIPYQGSKGHPGPGYLIHFHVSIRLVCASPANNKTLDLTRCQELKPYQVRYGSNVVHSFTEWQANNAPFAMYDHRADYRSWESTKLFLKAERRVGES